MCSTNQAVQISDIDYPTRNGANKIYEKKKKYMYIMFNVKPSGQKIKHYLVECDRLTLPFDEFIPGMIKKYCATHTMLNAMHY